MTVKLETTIKRFNGASTDDKPIVDVPEGSTYHCVDTGERYIFHNDMWTLDLTLIVTIQRFQGLSTDIKPEAPAEGSTYNCVDTGERYVYYDGTWEEDMTLIYAIQMGRV